MSTLEQAQSDVQNCVDRTMAMCLSDGPRDFHEFEKQLGVLVFALARAFVVVFLVRRAGLPRAATYEVDARRWVVCGTLTDSLGTLFGVVSFTRPVGRKPGLKGDKCDRLVDRELGICGGFSLGTIERIGWLTAQMSFRAARNAFARFHDWKVCSRTQQRFIDALGAQCRLFFDAQGAPTGDGEILVAQVDAGAAPHISSKEMAARRKAKNLLQTGSHERRERRAISRQRPRKRRKSGQKSKNGKMAFVGILYSLKKTAQGLDGPINKRVYATFESHEALFLWLHNEVTKRAKGKPMYFLADGCEHIWRLQKQYFPNAHCCLDWFHLVEKFWDVGRCLHPNNRAACHMWIERIKSMLRKGNISAVFKELQDRLGTTAPTGPGNKTKRQRLEAVLKYLTDNRERLAYAAFRKVDMDIGTGLIEAAVRNLVRQRLDCSGMKWGRPRSECVLLLRCVLLDGLWQDFIDYIAPNRTFKLLPRPVPAVSHDAHRKVA